MNEMKPIEVHYENGHVYLVQLDPLGNDDAAICLMPEQVPLVCKWLREAAATARKGG